DSPRDRAGAVAAVGLHGPLRAGQGASLLRAAAAAEPARAARVGKDRVLARQDRSQPLLALERLDRLADAEDARRHVRAVLAVAAAPAVDHPVVPHEDRPLVVARVAPADEQV